MFRWRKFMSGKILCYILAQLYILMLGASTGNLSQRLLYESSCSSWPWPRPFLSENELCTKHLKAGEELETWLSIYIHITDWLHVLTAGWLPWLYGLFWYQRLIVNREVVFLSVPPLFLIPEWGKEEETRIIQLASSTEVNTANHFAAQANNLLYI